MQHSNGEEEGQESRATQRKAVASGKDGGKLQQNKCEGNFHKSHFSEGNFSRDKNQLMWLIKSKEK